MQVLPDTPINSLHLSTKEQKALELLHISTVEEFSKLDLEKVLTLRGYGQTTYRKLAQFRRKLYGDKPPKAWTNSNTFVFSDFLKLQGGRTRRALELLKVNSFEKLNKITDMDILAIPTLGIRTWRQISKLQKQCQIQAAPCYEAIDWTNTPAVKDTVMALPLFSDHALPISDVDLHESYLPFHTITEIPLPAWSYPYLSQLAVRTLGELLLTPTSTLTDLNGFGEFKLAELRASVLDLLLPNIEYGDYYSKEATYENLHTFPFFSNKNQLAIKLDEIHESYKSQHPTASLKMPARALHACHSLKIAQVGQLLVTTPQIFADQGNFGDTTLSALRNIIEHFILHEDHKLDIRQDAKSLSDVVLRYIEHVLPNRARRIICLRYGLRDGGRRTLREVAQAMNLTRQRIRQLQFEAEEQLNGITNKEFLRPIENDIKEIICSAGGAIYFDEILPKLDSLFVWTQPSNVSLLRFLLTLLNDIDCDSRAVYLRDFACNYCNLPSTIIENDLTEQKECPLSQVVSHLLEACSKRNCDLIYKYHIRFSNAFITKCVCEKPTLNTQFVCYKDSICTRSIHAIKYGLKSEAVENILREATTPLHFKEVASEYRRCRINEDISDNAIHALLINQDNAISWDRGKFIHKDYITIRPHLTNSVSQWILRRLNEGLDFISIAGAYSHFSFACEENGIISELALYSYLRLTKPTTFFLQRYPFITRENKRVYIRDFLEEYVLSKGGEVAESELEQLIKKYGFRNPLGSVLNNVPNLLYSDRKTIIHVDELNMNLNTFHDICKYARDLVDKNTLVRTQKIFNDKKVSCKVLGITGPRLLHSCFSSFGQEYVAVGHGLNLKSLSKRRIKGLGIRSELENYIKLHGPCSRDELIRTFVDKMGYSEKSIDAIPYYSDDIVVYVQGCYIHVDSLGWDSGQREQLHAILIDFYQEKIVSGEQWARLKEVFDYRYNDLPDIKCGIPWTSSLLRDLTEQFIDIKFLGNAKDVYVQMTGTNINVELDELILLILNDEFDGATNKEALEQILVRKGLIRKNLTLNMINGSQKIAIRGKYVIAQGLNNA